MLINYKAIKQNKKAEIIQWLKVQFKSTCYDGYCVLWCLPGCNEYRALLTNCSCPKSQPLTELYCLRPESDKVRIPNGRGRRKASSILSEKIQKVNLE